MAAPVFEITPRHVIKYFAKKYRIKFSESDAREWLKLWGYTFAQDLKEIATPHLERIFEQATIRDYPSKAFTRFSEKVDQAIAGACDDYGAKVGLEWRGDAVDSVSRGRLVDYLIRANGAKREAVFCLQITFSRMGANQDEGTESDYRMHFSAHGKKIAARILEPGERVARGVKVFGASKPAVLQV